MADNVRTCQVTGDYSVFGKKGGSRRKKRVGGNNREGEMDGEEDVLRAPIVMKQSGGVRTPIATAGVVPLTTKMPIIGYTAPSIPLQGAPLQSEFKHILPPTPAVATVSPPSPPMQHSAAGGGIVKVELRRPAADRRVHLNPKKMKVNVHKDRHTRKVRKITLGLHTMHRRVTRAKKIRDHVTDMPVDVLRKELIGRGLIKETSKAPESILRQIAADAQIVGGKGL